MDNSDQKVENIIKKLGIRLTKQRKVILAVLIEHQGQHFCAEDIYCLLQKQGRKIGLATIYRTLDLLEENGLVASRKFGSSSTLYEYVGNNDPTHHHLICKQCGKVIETSDLLVSDWQEKLAAKEGFAATDCCIQIKGFCDDCR